MAKTQSDMWNERYANEAFVYGETPNQFFKEELLKLEAGSILLPAEGEGRNAVFAASQLWQVNAFDQSKQGRLKAINLAEKHQVEIKYDIADFENFNSDKESYDCIALIYAHVSEIKRQVYHRLILDYLKPGGILLLEGFSKKQLGKKSGGPGQEAMLFSKEILLDDFSNLEVLKLEELDVELNEGEFHQGMASVIRFVGRKID
ncbi:class I SAM-dependent methyltransferase [Ancylomarina sp. DW003]|nr:class I SAM-dependent methyltransferase [Ancylomarina sp. DW003]MDE5421816.1 class I SAM-dependent methyltransferase [Ancylomarina sp. DW003]